MLSSQLDQADRKENDKRVREQTRTFMSHTHSEIGGRYSSENMQTIIGAQPITNYPAASAHQCDPCGQEPSLGYRIDALPDLEPSHSSAHGEPTSGERTPSPMADVEGVVGSPPLSSRRTYRRI